MATGRIDEVGILHTGQTGPAYPIAVTQDDDTTAEDLTGYAARIIFWYAGSDPHYIGDVAITDPVNGAMLYDWTGLETPTAGELLGQVERINPGSIDQATQEWTVKKMQPFKWRVIQAAA